MYQDPSWNKANLLPIWGSMLSTKQPVLFLDSGSFITMIEPCWINSRHSLLLIRPISLPLDKFPQHKALSCINQVINPWRRQERPISIRESYFSRLQNASSTKSIIITVSVPRLCMSEVETLQPGDNGLNQLFSLFGAGIRNSWSKLCLLGPI